MIAQVIVDIANDNVDKCFEYNIPEHLNIVCGMRVLVPFSTKQLLGFVIGITEKAVTEKALKDIISPIDDYAIINSEQIELMHYMNKRYNNRYIDILRLFLPSTLRKSKIKEKTVDYITIYDNEFIDEQIQTINPRQKNKIKAIERVMDCDYSRQNLNKLFGKKNIDELIQLNILKSTTVIVKQKPYSFVAEESDDIKLTSEQEKAFSTIVNSDNPYILIRGVTGSGKTEIYLNLIKECLASGKNVIVLAPEIALTPQLIARFRGNFDDLVAIQHSKLTERERYDEWTRIKSGEARIVIGARSAVFCPLKDIGLIIIDEEHDSSYTSENNPRYFAHEIAIKRIDYYKGKVVLGSATPSIETYKNALDGKYKLVELLHRANSIIPPNMEIIDMGKELIRGNNSIFSNALKNAIKETLDNNEQAIIFLNRRGYASFVMCKKCGYIAKCDDCDVSLTYHQADNQLKCHYCNKRYHMPKQCPKCGNVHIKLGRVGTERVVNELQLLFKSARISRLDNDVAKSKISLNDVLTDFKEHKSDILVGTQMIAKGHNFKDVTLVGIIDTDMNLYFSDYRAQERTFQLVMQVAGRAGRYEKQGRVLLQTNSSSHYVLKYASTYDYLGFYEKELNLRQVTKFPPFSTVVRILVSGITETNVQNATQEIFNKCKEDRATNPYNYLYISAMRSPTDRIEGKYRYQIMLRIEIDKEKETLEKLFTYANGYDKIASVWVEINPQNLN